MTKRRPRKSDPNDADELVLTVDPMTGLPALTVEPRTTPVPDKPRRRDRKKS